MKLVLVCLFLATAIAGTLLVTAQAGTAPVPYKNANLPVEQRVSDLLGRMTLEEKVDMLNGAGWMETKANERLGIPSLKMADGPLGVRYWAGPSADPNAAEPKGITSTAFPAGVALAATWNTELVRSVGQAIGQETKALGRDMILGPTVNINRVPMWGRNFEGYGEDPYLASRMAVAYIKGVQSEGIIATVKHFAANNQEYERRRVDEKISERTLHEIYLPAFQAAVQEAGVWSVMSAYNKVNGNWCAENPYLLTDVLKKEWGFRGFVVSDWGGTHSTVNTIRAGLDLEMPDAAGVAISLKKPEEIRTGFNGAFLTREKLIPALADKQITTAMIDDKVSRLLRAMFANGLFDHPHAATGKVDTPEQKAIARRAATESIVLLKNTGGVLPLAEERIHSIAVIGPNAAVGRTGGGGSSRVKPAYAVSPLEGLRELAPNGMTIRTASAGLGAAVTAAQRSDAAVVFAGYSPETESEDFDRASLDLPEGQDELIQAVAAANRNTIVVVNAGGPVHMSKWAGNVAGILMAWYGGQEGGHAIADILLGNANPSGRLPVTFPKEWKDSAAYGHYPGENNRVEYAEGIYMGYRHFDKTNIEPEYPFGYGLSYTRFDYSGLKVEPPAPGKPAKVAVVVRNTGAMRGAEVVQLYLHDVQAKVDRPVKELKGFRRVELAPGEEAAVTFTVDEKAMSYYDPGKKAWVADPGTFEVLAGASSRDIRLKGSFTR